MKFVALAAGLLFLSASAFAAQYPAQSPDQGEKTTHKKVRTITGCLEKSGGGGGEYKLTTEAGGTWEIRSDAVNLGEHVGHTVRVTGAVRNATAHGMKEDAKEKAAEHGVDKNETEHGHMEVTNVKHVSDSCKSK